MSVDSLVFFDLSDDLCCFDVL